MFTYIVNHFPAVVVCFAVACWILAISRSVHARRAAARQAAAAELAKRRAEEEKARRRSAAIQRRTEQAQRSACAAAARKVAREQAQREKEQARETKRLEKLEYARQLAELNERAARAARELKELNAAPEQPAAVVETPAADPAPVAVSLAQFAAAHTASDNAAKPFQNETVSFTGKLSSMTRAQAIEKVKQAGGRAYADMPAGTTLLVVGINPGEKKQAKYDKWIGQCRKITETQFLEMLASA